MNQTPKDRFLSFSLKWIFLSGLLFTAACEAQESSTALDTIYPAPLVASARDPIPVTQEALALDGTSFPTLDK